MWSIRILSGPQTGQIVDLKLGKNVFGRSQACDVKIQSLGISKEHCEVHVYKDKMMIVDLKSSNGTFVNGVKIQNSIIHLGDKLSLFDVIMDVIPAPDIRPKSVPVVKTPPPPQQPMMLQVPSIPNLQNQMVTPTFPQSGIQNVTEAYSYNSPMQYQQSSYQTMSQQAAPPSPTPAVPSQTLSEKMEMYIENTVMPAIYKLAILMPFKQILMGFILIFIIGVTLLSLIPLNIVTKESNFNEAGRRAKSVARSLARVNEAALLSGQLGNLNVSDALKEDGIKEALIVQQSDGAIVAPPEKAGREATKPFIAQARKESRSAVGMIDSNTIGATHPIGVYDANTGESMVKYHAIVYYDISSLGVDQGRVISLFMQTLVIATVLGLLLFLIFSRLIQHPLTALNKQIDQALREKTDRTEVAFDYPEFQKVVANVNLILNRMWNGLSDQDGTKPQQNRDLEFINLVQILTQPAIVISNAGTIVAVNEQFEQISQMSNEALIQAHFSTITDAALMQNIEALIAKAKDSPYEKHSDRIPFSQFECTISIQSCLGSGGEPEYYFMTLARIEQG
jgi:pSer/pThr/pTyr-binding forkhead associated (FHA) protein